jgi:hypothetical protein
MSDYQIELIWQGLLGAEIRAAYFGELSHRLLRTQRLLTLASLLLSSGAGVSLLTSVPTQYSWIKPAMAFLAAGISLWSLVAKNERGSIDAADLHLRWNKLAMGYGDLWANVHIDRAAEQLAKLRDQEADISKSSTAMPDKKSLMLKCQENILMHHQHQLAA